MRNRDVRIHKLNTPPIPMREIVNSESKLKVYTAVSVTAISCLFLTGYVGGIVGLYYIYYFVWTLIVFSCIISIVIELVARIRKKQKNTSIIYTIGRLIRNFISCLVLTVIALVLLRMAIGIGLFIKTSIEDIIASDTPAIVLSGSNRQLVLKVPRNEFVDEQYRPDYSGDYHIYIDRRVRLAGYHTSRSVRSSYQDLFEQYNVENSGEFHGLLLFEEHRGGGDLPYMFGDHYFPIDESIDLIIVCNTSTTGYTGCSRKAKSDTGELHYSYRLEPEELSNWLRIETVIRDKLKSYIQHE